MDSLIADGQRLLGSKQAMEFLRSMPRTTFYRNIKRGIIPKPRYMSKSPVWRLDDLRNIYNQLPESPSPEALSPSK